MEIIQKSKFSYSIEFKNHTPKNEILLCSLMQSKLLGAGTTITPTFNKISFNASNVLSLNNLLSKYKDKNERNIAKLDYNEAEQLVDSLSTQITYLNKHGHTFYNFSLENIIVIDKNNKKVFLCIDTNYLLKIKDQYITFTEPFNIKEEFLNPEIKKITSLPSSAHYQSILHSLGNLALFCILQDFNTNKDKKLEQIKYTRLYWKLLAL